MRSKLFVPASRPELYPKALAGAADAISFDLEDAVAESRKSEARATLGQALRSAAFTDSAKLLLVRVNAPGTPHHDADLEAVVFDRLDLVNIPKVESADTITLAAATLERLEKRAGLVRPIGILANIETPRGLRRAAEIACAHPRVAGLQLGLADLLEPLGIQRGNAAAIGHLQLAVRLAAGEAGIWACDAAFGAVDDPEGFRQEARAAHALGYVGKSCIHPSQVALANDVFRPTGEELSFARRVVAAADEAGRQGVGAFLVDGRMIDAPFIRRARMIVAASSPPGAPGA